MLVLTVLLMWSFHSAQPVGNTTTAYNTSAPSRLYSPPWRSRAEHNMQPLSITFRFEDTQLSDGNRTTQERVISKCTMTGVMSIGGRSNATEDYIYFLTPLIFLQSSGSCGKKTTTTTTNNNNNNNNSSSSSSSSTNTSSSSSGDDKAATKKQEFNRVPCYMYEVKPGTGRLADADKVVKSTFPKSLLGHSMEPVTGGLFAGAGDFKVSHVTLDGVAVKDGAQVVMPATLFNESSPTRSIVITNTGTTKVHLWYVIEGNDERSFWLTPAKHEATVAPGASTTVTLTFHPYLTRQLHWLGSVMYIHTSDVRKSFRLYLYGIGLDNVATMTSNATGGDGLWNEGKFRSTLLAYSATIAANVTAVSFSLGMPSGSKSVVTVNNVTAPASRVPSVVWLDPAPLLPPVVRECGAAVANCTTNLRIEKKEYSIVSVLFRQTTKVVLRVVGLSMNANGGALLQKLRDNGNDPANLPVTNSSASGNSSSSSAKNVSTEYTFTLTRPMPPMTYDEFKLKWPLTADKMLTAMIAPETTNATTSSGGGGGGGGGALLQLALKSNRIIIEDTSVDFEQQQQHVAADDNDNDNDNDNGDTAVDVRFYAKSDFNHTERSDTLRHSESRVSSFVVFGGITHGGGPLLTNHLWFIHVHPPTKFGSRVLDSATVGALGKLSTASNSSGENAFHVRWERVVVPSGPTPPARHGHACKVTGPLIVVWSGAGVKGLRNDLWVYDGRFQGTAGATGCGCPGPWTQVVPTGKLPPARHHAASALLKLSNGKMYLVAYGGMGTEGMLQDAVLLELGGCREGIDGCPHGDQLRFVWFHIRSPPSSSSSHTPGPMVHHTGFQSGTGTNTFVMMGGYGYAQPVNYTTVHHMDENRQIEHISQYKIHLDAGDIWHNKRLPSTYRSTPHAPAAVMLPGNQVYRLTCVVASETSVISCAWRKGTVSAKLLLGNGTFSDGRLHAAATRLRDGRVLVSGGMANPVTRIFWNKYLRFPCEQQRLSKPLTMTCNIEFYKLEMAESKVKLLEPIKYPFDMFHDTMYILS